MQRPLLVKGDGAIIGRPTAGLASSWPHAPGAGGRVRQTRLVRSRASILRRP